MDLFTRLRDLAFLDPTLNAIFGPTFDVNKFRWFDRQLPQGQIANGTCAVVQTVSQITTNLHNTPIRNPLTQDRVQISVVDKSPRVASSAAAAVCNFLDTANFWQNGAFASPRVANPPGTNIKLNQRGAFFSFQTDRPIPVEVLDYRIFNVDTA